MTEIESMLRRAATAMPDNPNRAEEILVRGRRRRRRRHQAAGAAAGLAAAVTVTVAVLTGGSNQAATPNTVLSAAAVTSAPAPHPTTAIARGRVVAVGSATVTLPAGWAVAYRGEPFIQGGNPEPGSEEVCVRPTAVRSEGCDDGMIISHGTIGGSEGSEFTAHQPGGWYTGTGVIACPVNGAVDGPRTNFAYEGRPSVAGGREPIETGTRQVGGLAAVYDVWSGYCDSGFTFTPRSWYLPEKKLQFRTTLSVKELGVEPETILSSVRFD
ncbi:hypothetical protein [Frankia sp. R82]|uniref:hypothetical protein n=1 Tax=Frankia sp. R82 TaxID=2950553 RepID=UPI002044863B|nr:hypothetical protein [Frankia sp. R82]MCM3887330.1 hypothetical protein [Frankia sp. R82]